jgi:hypothetical protein
MEVESTIFNEIMNIVSEKQKLKSKKCNNPVLIK